MARSPIATAKTAAKNETATAKTAATGEIAVFESREKEPKQFAIAGYTSIRNFGNGKLEWHVPEDDADRFAKHHHVTIGRVIRKRD
ncbi:hypothetical protein [Poseidonocella sp. HB161398]|uniref:hypothetical protein n=1 Tax=Poseidonocella sp. HB161398 TaxID=2320855 RepID=UPI001109D666|nr:hypothetical protein [Poseidonocella sp. HB161398]